MASSQPVDHHDDAPTAPATPLEPDTGAIPLSQVTLPSTEAPGSPMDPGSSFKTELNDERTSNTVIPSSLTPPPSTQAEAAAAAAGPSSQRTATLAAQQSSLCSPPTTVPNPVRMRDLPGVFVSPTAQQIAEAPVDELRTMLQSCVAENQKFKMETAHHKLQFNLFRMQAEEESMRAAVEHDMVRREVEALRTAEGSRQARRELSASADSMQSKYLQMKVWYDSAVDDNEILQRRLRVAKKVIQQKEEETIGLGEERDMLLTRIRENREHFHMLCSPGGIFHAALTPNRGHAAAAAPRQTQIQSQSQSQRQPAQREESQHGLSALLQAMSQDSHAAAANNGSTPTTPVQQQAPAGRRLSKHARNAQSLSSLPTTPMHRARGEHAALLPSADLVPQTEPRMRFSDRYFEGPSGRRSRESTISAEDAEDLMRLSQARHEGGSQASQKAAEMLRHRPAAAAAREPSPEGRVQAKLSNIGRGDKRKFGHEEEQASPKRARREQVGLGIQYQK